MKIFVIHDPPLPTLPHPNSIRIPTFLCKVHPWGVSQGGRPFQDHLEDDKNISSFVTLEEDNQLWEAFDIPDEFELQALDLDEKANNPQEGWIVVYEVFVKLEVRFPLPYLGSDILSYYHIALGHLMPNLWRTILDVVALAERVETKFTRGLLDK
ncbi:hypothetical protein L484_001483 [Morus notabilis]|uniref:Uncharacterized protein n=1 Tax=Morus notabilis TaxID=981085 RepID=W9RNF8_9ROSA|nr:hypothetical protein L484_001483 [Morus notabilis]